MARPGLRAAAVAVACGLAACGGNADSDTGTAIVASPTPAVPAPTPPPQVERFELSATGNAAAPRYGFPPEPTAGPLRVVFTNNTTGYTDAQLVRVEGEHSEAEIAQQFRNAVAGKAVADWFVTVGGVGETPPGRTGSALVTLPPAQLYVAGGQRVRGTLPAITVQPSARGSELPAPDAGRLVAKEYSFAGSARSGGTRLQLDNEGREWHQFSALPIREGSTLADVEAYLLAEDKPDGPPPFKNAGGFDSAVLDPGESEQIVIPGGLKPGGYALVCFVPDKAGGPLHFTRGQISELTVR